MASGKGPSSGAGEDVVDGVIIKAGEVVYKGKDHEVSLLEKGLRLVGFSGSEPGVTPVKKSKSVPKSGAASPQTNTFVLHYIVRDKKTKKCRCQSIQLDAKEESSDNWISQIEKMRKEGKPQKLLVIINPIGGTGIARKQFEKVSRPLFDLAGIELVVKVTERAQHAREIAQNFDTSTVDGVIIVGGDGLYMEVLHTLVLKTQEEAGIDVNDPDAKLVPLSVNFGLIPGGETNGTGVFSVHEPGKLIHYCGILLGYGLYPDMMDKIDSLRWMKKARIAYVGLTKLFGKKRVYDLDVEVLRALPQGKNMDIKPVSVFSREADTDNAAAKPGAGWTSLGVKHITAMMAILAHVDMDTEGNNIELDPFTDVFHLSLVSTQSGLDYGKMLHEYSQRKKDTYTHDYVEMVNKIQGLRFRLVDDEKKEGAASDGSSGRRDVSRLLDVDGETMMCTVPNIELRYLTLLPR
ncbi:hypothetical protein BaRGS_00012857 [Batillaria attramentaria]|uniref:DAGKc domain-containing protein n=1 Tax=Batillaria attramentaria TaxID=370345 RepID=A0ABD0L9N8_9CAEN